MLVVKYTKEPRSSVAPACGSCSSDNTRGHGFTRDFLHAAELVTRLFQLSAATVGEAD